MELEQQRMDMMASKYFLDKLVQTCPDGIIGIDRKGTVIIFNVAAEKLTGLAVADVIGKMSIQAVYDVPEMAREIKKQIYSEEHGGPGRLDGLEVTVKGPEGRKIPIRLSAALIFENEVEAGSVGFFHDLTDRKEMEEELRRRSITDSLTNLYNRRHFHTTLTEEMARCTRYGGPLSLAVFDLDNFKPFNDTYGHQEGDTILRLLAECIASVFRSTDNAFRLGGDEFAVLLVETEIANAGQVMERFKACFGEEWAHKMAYLGQRLRPVTMSIGVAQLAAREKADKFQLRADLAMYEAKNSGGGRVVLASEHIGI
jgi:diguanylate cyclase (GGDEF)-like protein/PAS domain S-box-containing protein